MGVDLEKKRKLLLYTIEYQRGCPCEWVLEFARVGDSAEAPNHFLSVSSASATMLDDEALQRFALELHGTKTALFKRAQEVTEQVPINTNILIPNPKTHLHRDPRWFSTSPRPLSTSLTLTSGPHI